MDILMQALHDFLFGFFFGAGWWVINRILNRIFG